MPVQLKLLTKIYRGKTIARFRLHCLDTGKITVVNKNTFDSLIDRKLVLNVQMSGDKYTGTDWTNAKRECITRKGVPNKALINNAISIYFGYDAVKHAKYICNKSVIKQMQYTGTVEKADRSTKGSRVSITGYSDSARSHRLCETVLSLYNTGSDYAEMCFIEFNMYNSYNRQGADYAELYEVIKYFSTVYAYIFIDDMNLYQSNKGITMSDILNDASITSEIYYVSTPLASNLVGNKTTLPNYLTYADYEALKQTYNTRVTARYTTSSGLRLVTPLTKSAYLNSVVSNLAKDIANNRMFIAKAYNSPQVIQMNIDDFRAFALLCLVEATHRSVYNKIVPLEELYGITNMIYKMLYDKACLSILQSREHMQFVANFMLDFRNKCGLFINKCGFDILCDNALFFMLVNIILPYKRDTSCIDTLVFRNVLICNILKCGDINAITVPHSDTTPAICGIRYENNRAIPFSIYIKPKEGISTEPNAYVINTEQDLFAALLQFNSSNTERNI